MIPDIPDIIASLVGSGTYYAEAKVILEDGSQMTCIYIRLQIE